VLNALRERMDRAFQETMQRPREEELYAGTWVPPVDIYETSDRLVLKAELPGFDDDDVGLRFEDGILTLEGERKFEKERGDENYHRVERSYGRFTRSFSLPTTVDTDRIAARLEKGVLTVELPKREETKPKQIRIQATSKEPVVDVKKAE
jgi:HSP20 family protein